MEVVLKKGDKTVGLMTIKQFAESQNVTYEAVRKQIVSYGEDLKDHIIRNGRTHLQEMSEKYAIARVVDPNECRIIELQDEVKKNLEARVKYTALLEDNKAKEEKLKEAECQITEIKRESDGLSREMETIREETDNLRKKTEEDQRMIESLQKERDEAQIEAQSFTRSFLGFYRKNKQS